MGFLDGHVAVVTGAAQGIGRAYAAGLAADGAEVAVADVRIAEAGETVAQIEAAGGTAIAVHMDVGDQDSISRAASEIRRQLGNVHILVNNAAIYGDLKATTLMGVDMAYWRLVYRVNVEGPLMCCQAFAPMMIEDGWGRIVNQTSVGAYMGLPSLYGTTKLALVGLTQGLAKELGPHGITVNSIAPGTIHTEATMTVVPEQLRRAQLSRQAIPKEGMPEDLVGTLLYLVGEGSAWVTAQTIFVDGGAVPRV